VCGGVAQTFKVSAIDADLDAANKIGIAMHEIKTKIQ